jgi:hypothetical protein
MQLIKLSVAKDFSTDPGPRYRWEGEESGEQFREEFLEPNFRKAIETNGYLEVNLDGVEGFGTSFLEEAFGGLARIYGTETVLKHLRIVSGEENYRDEVLEYIDEANNQNSK